MQRQLRGYFTIGASHQSDIAVPDMHDAVRINQHYQNGDGVKVHIPYRHTTHSVMLHCYSGEDTHSLAIGWL